MARGRTGRGKSTGRDRAPGEFKTRRIGVGSLGAHHVCKARTLAAGGPGTQPFTSQLPGTWRSRAPRTTPWQRRWWPALTLARRTRAGASRRGWALARHSAGDRVPGAGGSPVSSGTGPPSRGHPAPRASSPAGSPRVAPQVRGAQRSAASTNQPRMLVGYTPMCACASGPSSQVTNLSAPRPSACVLDPSAPREERRPGRGGGHAQRPPARRSAGGLRRRPSTISYASCHPAPLRQPVESAMLIPVK